MSKSFIAALFCLAAATAAVVDRVAVVVGKIVITESEVLQEVRLTAFLNNASLDLGPEQRRAAAERLVDQQLIRTEMEIGRYPEPSPTEADAVVRKFRQEHYSSIPEFRSALEKYGITEEQLKAHLIWQLGAIHFTDLRFRAGLPPSTAQPSNGLRGGPGTTSAANSVAPLTGTNRTTTSTGANRAAPANGVERSETTSKAIAPVTGQAASEPAPANVDQQMDAWLKEARGQTRIQFKKEAFQ